MFLKPRTVSGLLDAPLLRLSDVDTFDVRHLFENVAIFGQPGSGKTSGSGAHLARAVLRAGCGMLVLCAKPDERALWERYCSETGRTHSLLIFDGKQHRYNFIAAELARLGVEAISSVIDLIMQVMESARALSPNARQGGDVFWEDMVKLILRHTLIVLYLATGTISICDIISFVRSAPRSAQEMDDPAWQARSFFANCFAKAAPKMTDALGIQLVSFWRDEWMNLDNKTKSNAAISLTATLDRFNHGWLRDAFTTDTTMTPELLMHGAVIILDMPALTHMEDGILAQRLLKFITQRILLARQSYGAEHAERPVVVWIDEAPIFTDSHDAKYLALGRSTGSCTVLIAQSMPSYYATMGGENARDRVEQILSCCATKVYHCNSCVITNKIASDTIGRGLHRRASYNESEGENTSYGMNMGDGTNWSTSSGTGGGVSFNSEQRGATISTSWNSGRSSGGNDSRGRNRGHGSNSSTTQGYSEQMDVLVESAAFSRLKTGGPHNGFRTSAILFSGGRLFGASGGPALCVEFRQ